MLSKHLQLMEQNNRRRRLCNCKQRVFFKSKRKGLNYTYNQLDIGAVGKMQTKQIGIILLIGLLILGVIGAGIPYTTSQFIWQSTDLNYVKFYAGEYDGNGLIIDGNIFTIFDLNGSGGSGSFTDTNFETAGLTLTGSNTGDQDLSGYLQLAGGTMTGALKMGDNVTINQGGSDQYEQYFDGTNQRYELTSGAFKFNKEMFVDGQSITYGATGGSPSNTDNYHYQDALVWHHDSHNKDGAFVITLPSVGNSMSVFKIEDLIWS